MERKIMPSPIRLHDALENGGSVTSASSTIFFIGQPIARQGDDALCALHGETTIAEGDASFLDQDGKSVAMHLHRCACGCRVLASLTNVDIA
jgi:uncharacterized Zn-binding protein involved in type VI secretion